MITKKKIANAVIFTFLVSLPAHSLVQIFDRGIGGINPYTGVVIHPDNIQWMLGFGYNIEGRATIGVAYSKPFQDTLFQSLSGIASSTINPYLSMEIMEPDKVFPVGVNLNLNYRYYSGRQESAVGILLREQKQNRFEGGPEFSGQFFIGDAGTLIPSVAYGLIWSTASRRDCGKEDTDGNCLLPGNIKNTDGFLHDINLNLIYSHMFSEELGITANPIANFIIDPSTNPNKIKFSNGDKILDFYFSLNIGLVVKIR